MEIHRRINSQYSPPHRTSLATDYRESNLTLDTWEKVRSKGLPVHCRGYKNSTLVALIRNATAGYWRPGSSDKAAILAEVSYRRHHTTTGQRSGPSTSLIPIQWSSLMFHAFPNIYISTRFKSMQISKSIIPIASQLITNRLKYKQRHTESQGVKSEG